MKNKSPRLVEVVWVDSAFNRGWGDSAEKLRTMGISDCRTVGYLVERSRKQVKLAMSTADNATSYGDGMSIPSSCVKRVRYLK